MGSRSNCHARTAPSSLSSFAILTGIRWNCCNSRKEEAPEPWRSRAKLDGQIGLGIDHSAICVADADASAGFYRNLGLGVGDATLNRGPAQERLDGLSDVEVRVVPMNPPEQTTPHLELLGYRTPKVEAQRALEANDVAATRIVWDGQTAAVIADPDGHLQQVRA